MNVLAPGKVSRSFDIVLGRASDLALRHAPQAQIIVASKVVMEFNPVLEGLHG